MNRRALLLGCGTFEKLPDLGSPRRDVDNLARALANKGYEVATSEPDPDSQRVRLEIEGFFKTAEVTDGMNLLYLSCHGVQDSEGQLHFAFADTDPALLGSTAVSAEWVRKRLQSSRSRRTTVLLDCCFSGAFLIGMRIRSVDTGVKALVPELPPSRGVAVLTSSGATQISLEDASGDGHSYFTDAVVEGLESGAADLNGDGWITVDELYKYVCDLIERGPSEQNPQRFGVGQGSLVVAEVTAAGRIPMPATRTAAPTPNRRHVMAGVVLATVALAGTALTVPHLPGVNPAAGERPRTPVTESAAASVPPVRPSRKPIPSSTSPIPEPPPVADPPPSTVETNTPRTTTTTTTTTSEPPDRPERAKAVTVSSGTISSPANESDVKKCSYFTGTAKLAEGKTLILANRNLTNDDPEKYVQ